MNDARVELQLGTVRITDKGVEELSGDIIAIGVPRLEITRIELCYSVAAERPIPQMVFGIFLVGVGFLT